MDSLYFGKVGPIADPGRIILLKFVLLEMFIWRSILRNVKSLWKISDLETRRF